MMQYTQEAAADVEDAVRNLQNLPDEHLKRLIEDDNGFEEYFKALPQVTFGDYPVYFIISLFFTILPIL